MPALTRRTPKLCRDRNQAYVKINGRRIQCGRWGTPEAQTTYDQIISEWLHNGRRLPRSTAEQSPDEVTVAAVALAYWRHAKRRYRGNTLANIQRALRRLRRLYGREPAAEFGPKRLDVIRSQLIREKLTRSTIDKHIQPIRHAFRYAAAQEMIEARTYRRLCVLEPLRQADLLKQSRKIDPVPRAQIRRSRRELPHPLRALIDLQLLTGARAGELVRLKATDLNIEGDVWTYRPRDHKTAYRGRARVIYFGPRAQRILQQFMRPGAPVDRPLFSPREANAEAKRRNAKAGRRPGQKPTPRRSDRTIRDAYTVATYRRAIERACDKAFPPPEKLKGDRLTQWRKAHRWTPHRLRHNAATFLRRAFGIEVARIILGHTSSAVTEIYAEVDHAKAIEVIRKIG